MVKSLEAVLNELVEHRPNIQEGIEQETRAKWERHDITIISVSGDESNTRETSF
jgi:hypothetical protein